MGMCSKGEGFTEGVTVSSLAGTAKSRIVGEIVVVLSVEDRGQCGSSREIGTFEIGSCILREA